LLADSLKSGLPIPSFRQSTAENPLHEKPNSIQEIFLASWLHRNSEFRARILQLLKVISASEKSNDALQLFKNNIVKEFYRFDRMILSSIQISEWVDLLCDDGADSIDNQNYAEIVRSKPQKGKIHQLVDSDIFNNLLTHQIQVIPLINAKKQLGTTSLDIRLGTSFEVFFPNQFGIVDFTNEETMRKFKNNSRRYNLDFVDYIPINPGQFILGHSTEYIKLPKDISAHLEGRSSFARLGIEIHMTAGFVDPGFEGVLTFEIFNAGTNPIMLYPGYRVGQLRFTKIGRPSIGYTERNAAKYSGLLEHNLSMQAHDYEILRICGAQEKQESEPVKEQRDKYAQKS
jgi:dCTP deaminase